MGRVIANEPVATQLLLHLFGDLRKTIETLAPEGWEASEYFQLEHPTVVRLHQEMLQHHENLMGLTGKHDLPPTLEEVQAEFQEQACYPIEELTKLLGE